MSKKKILIIALVVIAAGGIFYASQVLKETQRQIAEQVARVSGVAMEPTFSDGDIILVDKEFKQLVRGDIVVFRPPQNPDTLFVKRIVGLPGERIQTINGDILINGAILDEKTYLPSGVKTYGKTDIKLGDKEFFVLGDNRDKSSDSRLWGPLPLENIVSRFVAEGKK
jgi:signal peptidase I